MYERILVTIVGILFLTISTSAFAQEVLYTVNFEGEVAEGWELERGWSVKRDEGNFVLGGRGIIGRDCKKGRTGAIIPFDLALS